MPMPLMTIMHRICPRHKARSQWMAGRGSASRVGCVCAKSPSQYSDRCQDWARTNSTFVPTNRDILAVSSDRKWLSRGSFLRQVLCLRRARVRASHCHQADAAEQAA
jgi:hypothetical protein